jgi:hypothetical protein
VVMRPIAVFSVLFGIVIFGGTAAANTVAVK